MIIDVTTISKTCVKPNKDVSMFLYLLTFENNVKLSLKEMTTYGCEYCLLINTTNHNKKKYTCIYLHYINC